MSASTMNPPLPFTKDAIIGNFQIHATNGPAYVQLQATRALARLKGMYEEARLLAREAFNTKHQDTPQPQTDTQQGGDTTDDGYDPTDLSMYLSTKSGEDDEEAANQRRRRSPLIPVPPRRRGERHARRVEPRFFPANRQPRRPQASHGAPCPAASLTPASRQARAAAACAPPPPMAQTPAGPPIHSWRHPPPGGPMTTLTAPATETLLYEERGHVAIITLNRPERLNAITGEMLEALSAQLIACQREPDIRVIVLTGAGRGFCAGLDLVDQQQRLEGNGASNIGAPGYSLFDLRDAPPTVLHRMDKPVICALNGAAAGYGMDMALLADIRVASDRAKMGAVFARRGVLPESGGTWILPRLLGWARAAEVAFRGRVLDAQESLDVGLVNEIVPHDELMTRTMELADEIAANAPLSVQATKRMMRLGMDEPFEAAVDHIYLQLLPLFQSDDFKEGVRSFMEKREPNFQGR